jgi:hypothetical protein
MNFDIMEVLRRAWKITWKHKVLWLFGMLASCGRGGNSSSNSNQRRTSSGQFPSDGPFSNEMMQQMNGFIRGMESWFSEHTWVIIALVIFFILLVILQIFVSVTGGIGLIRGAHQVETGVEEIQFGSLFGESLRYFWRVIGLGFTVFLPVIIGMIGFFFLVIFSLERSSPSTDAAFPALIILMLISVCCCFLPFMIALGLYYSQAIRALILEDLGVFESLSRGWEIFRKNIGGLLLMTLIIFFINLLLGVLIAIPIYVAVFPIFFKLMDGSITSWQPFLLAGIFLLCYSPIAWFLRGVLTTYTETIWTLIYMRVTQPKEDTPISLPADA